MATTKKTELEKALAAFDAAVLAHAEGARGFEYHDGQKILLPRHIGGPREAAKALLEFEKAMDEDASMRMEFIGHIDDMLFQFHRAMEDTFGQFIAMPIRTFFGIIPARSRTIKIGVKESVSVPYGKVGTPGLPLEFNIGWEENSRNKMKSKLIVVAEFKRRYQFVVDDIERRVSKMLREQSIFRGKPFDTNFEFMDLSNIDPSKLVFNRSIEDIIDARITVPLLRYKSMTASERQQFKSTFLLAGDYGVGKTYLASVLAQTAEREGITFIMVKPGHSVIEALEAAFNNLPALVFAEDIDSQAGGEDRTQAINQLLETLDGTGAKNKEVMVLLTTNHPEAITPAMLRPGRIDGLMYLGNYDLEATARLIRVIAGDKLTGELDEQAIFAAAEGYAPAFLVNAVGRAARYAEADLFRKSGIVNGKIKLTSDNIVRALEELRPQFDLMTMDRAPKVPQIDAAFRETISSQLASIEGEITNRVQGVLEEEMDGIVYNAAERALKNTRR